MSLWIRAGKASLTFLLLEFGQSLIFVFDYRVLHKGE